MVFHGWGGVLRVLAAGVLGYAALVLVLRISGKRTLSKMNAFDLVVSIESEDGRAPERSAEAVLKPLHARR